MAQGLSTGSPMRRLTRGQPLRGWYGCAPCADCIGLDSTLPPHVLAASHGTAVSVPCVNVAAGLSRRLYRARYFSTVPILLAGVYPPPTLIILSADCMEL
jgi:hypothetical protein